MIFITSTFLIIKPIYSLIIRTFFITFFAIFGIIYTPILSSYKFFRNIALFLISFIPQSILNFLPDCTKNIFIYSFFFIKKKRQVRD